METALFMLSRDVKIYLLAGTNYLLIGKAVCPDKSDQSFCSKKVKSILNKKCLIITSI